MIESYKVFGNVSNLCEFSIACRFAVCKPFSCVIENFVRYE